MSNTWNKLIYSFPVQLLALQLRRNLFMLAFWVWLIMVFTGNFGKVLGIPYLFLDPEYLNRVDFWSFFIVGFTLGGFTVAFNISSYILYGHKYSFLGVLERPFTKFSINNSLLPVLINGAYLVYIVRFQLQNDAPDSATALSKAGGFVVGFVAMLALLYTYFRQTNKDIFKFLSGSVDKRLKKVKLNRKRALDKLKEVRDRQYRVDFYFDEKMRLRPTEYLHDFYDKEAILKVFDQNHFNLVLIELVIILVVLLLGFFMDNPYFQIPAAASAILFGTIFIMLTGAISYWFRSWGIIVSLAAFMVINMAVKMDFYRGPNPAFGLDYHGSKATYSVESLQAMNTLEKYQRDKEALVPVLESWKAKQRTDTAGAKPRMILLCVSGGGQRAALWTMAVLQKTDSLLQGELLDRTMLITGASGGIVGAAYYRELFLREKSGEIESRNGSQYLDKIAMDNLNPMIFSLLVNDMFVRFQYFNYDGQPYLKDRGYAFENQLNRNTDFILEKKLKDYREVEAQATVPILLMAPTIVNDGRKLFISSQNVGFMTIHGVENASLNTKVKGVDFRHFFSEQGSDELRFLSALRMSATFPYITPNIELPSNPPLEIMDAGISDNYGISDAIGFLYVFKDWIADNTSGVIILSVRDHEKDAEVEKKVGESIVQNFSAPISSVYNNLGNIQDLNNDSRIEYATEWFKGNLYQIDIEYNTNSMLQDTTSLPEAVLLERKQNERASLNWHLTTREKKNIIDNIHQPNNQKALRRLKQLVEE